MTVYTDYRLVVYPRDAGDFGICSISGIYRTHAEEMALLKRIKADILRHVNDISAVYIQFDTEDVTDDD